MAVTIGIIGSAHSGSTILARWLSQIDGAIALGEVESVLRKKSFDKNDGTRAVERCSCGQTMQDCPVWKNNFETYDDITSFFYNKTIIDSSKNVLGDLNIFIYKNPIQLLKSAKTPAGYVRLLKQTLASWLKVRKTKHITFSYTYFTKHPNEVLEKVASEINASIDGVEKSHIAYSNKSKYSPLKIIKR